MLSLEQILLIIISFIAFILAIRLYLSSRQLSTLKTTSSEHTLIKEALNSMALPMYYKDKSGKLIGTNKSFEREFGAFKKETLERLNGVRIPSADEIELIYDNNIQKSALVYTSHFLDDSKNILGSVGVIVNIDIQKDEKKSLIEQKNRLHNALECSLEGYWEWNIEEDKALYSKRWKEIMGYTYEDDEPKNLSAWLNLVDSLDLAKTNEKLRAHLDGKSDFLDLEHRVKTSEEILWVNIRAKAILNLNNQPIKLIGTIRDISDIKKIEYDLKAQKELFVNFMDNLPLISFIKDKHGKYIYANTFYQKFLGFVPWKNKTTEQLYPPLISQSIKNSDREAMYEAISTHEEIIPDAQGSSKLIKTFKFPIETKNELLLCGIGLDITSEKRYKDTMNLYLKILDSSKDGIIITDSSRQILAVNKSFEKLSGFLSSDVKGKDISFRNSDKHPEHFYKKIWEEVLKEGEWSGEAYNKNKDDSVDLEILNIHSIKDSKGQVKYYYMLIQTTQREKIIENNIQLPTDTITNLPNKSAFKHLLDIAIAKAHRNQEKLSIIYINVDDFNVIGKNKGKEIAEYALKEIGKKLLYAIRQNDVLAKLDSDEFAIILEDTKTSKDISIICERIMEEMTKPILMHNTYETISLSIGASIYPDHSSEPKKLIDFAHGCMYKAKREGKNGYIIHQS